ncbi:hypothetical protein ACH8I4_01460, partial [Acinetobacter sp. ABJ_C3_5]|uniref:AbiJ-related protein n=1 Tax=Acinetobacter courvalinii TaxID=280147 RepID=UPI0037CC9122
MFKLLPETKTKIINTLISQENLFGSLTDIEVLELFDSLLDLKSLPTTDFRTNQYPTAYEDFYQHFVNNNDWSIEEILKVKFDLTKNDDTFINFINKIVSPSVRINQDEALHYCNLIESALGNENLIFQIWDHDNNQLPIYRLVQNSKNKDYLRNIPKNKIKFHVDKSEINYTEIVYPCFILRNINFNDFGNHSNFFLDYYVEKNRKTRIGRLKIIKKDDFDT